MILRTVHCMVSGCGAAHTEAHYNQGFPGWCDVSGLAGTWQDPATGQSHTVDRAFVCPRHARIVRSLFRGELDHLLQEEDAI